MRRLLCCLLAMLMLASMTACDLDTTPGKEVEGSGVTNTQKDDTFGLNETAVFKALKFTAAELKENEGTEYFVPEEGNVFVGVKFTIENVSDEEQVISSVLLFEAYADDVKCNYSVSAVCAFNSETLDGTLAPGKKLVGWYAVEVPIGWEKIELNVQSDVLSDSTAKFVFTK